MGIYDDCCPDQLYEMWKEEQMEEERRRKELTDEMFAKLVEIVRGNEVISVPLCLQLKSIYKDDFVLNIDMPFQSIMYNYDLVEDFIENHMEQKMPQLFSIINEKMLAS